MPSPKSSTGFFTSREMMRLTSGIVLLGIVGLMYLQTRKSDAWRSIATEAESAAPIAPWQERIVPHPGHTDPAEIEGFKEERQAITDQAPMAMEEMPAYWRMIKWAYAIPGAELRKQARTDLLFTHLFQASEQNRGQLVDVRLHVRRMAQHTAPKNSASVTTVYEAWGPTEDSQTFPYCVVFVDLPPGMKVQTDAFFDARFVGFYLKKLAYKDPLGNDRSAPLLIGRVVYDDVIAVQSQPASGGLTVPWVVGLVLSLVLIVALTQLFGRAPQPRPRTPTNDEATVDAFLEGLESGETSPELPDRKPPD